MTTVNPFDLLGEDDNDDPLQLIAAQQQKIVTKKVFIEAKPAKVPSKPIPPLQAVKEARNEVAPRGGDRSGAGRGRGGRRSAPRWEFESNGIVNGNGNGYSRGYGGDVKDGEANKPLEKMHPYYSDSFEPYRGGRRGSKLYDRHSGTGRGYGMKREGAGRGNWGTAIDEMFAQESELVAGKEDKDLISQKQTEQDDAPTSDANKEGKERDVNETEEKEPEDKEMTLDEYEKIMEEKRKSLLAMMPEERKVEFDKELESMHQLSLKKGSGDVLIKLGSDKDSGRRKESADRDESVKKSVSINEFLKPAEGERLYNPGGCGRGRGHGDRRQFRGGFGGGNTSTPAAPSIEDPGHFPTLGGK